MPRFSAGHRCLGWIVSYPCRGEIRDVLEADESGNAVGAMVFQFGSSPELVCFHDARRR